MPQLLQAVRGMNDILPHETPQWQYLETTLRNLLKQYGYDEIRLPLVESVELFQRSIGEVTDIIEKEMYHFEDRNGSRLALRPEGTAGCVRACLQHGLLHHQIQRLWYLGPMFRRERPQQGRYRQFYQCGVECYGMSAPDIDAELILLSKRLWQQLGLLNEHLTLQLNCLGDVTARQAYKEVLVDYFTQHRDQLDEDSIRRLTTNPLRILDSKNPKMQAMLDQAPSILEYLSASMKQHFDAICQYLDHAGVSYHINPRIVRGLDYYDNTVFEWVSSQLGAQATICAGGRYDRLVEYLGGKTTPAVGFAMGLERILSLINQHTPHLNGNKQCADIYVIVSGDSAIQQALGITEKLRDALSHLSIVMHSGGGKFKNQFKRADQSGARYALIIGDDEIAKQRYGLKNLRANTPQVELNLHELIHQLKATVGE